MRRYEHGGDTYSCISVHLDFSVNINPFGLPIEVREAIISHISEYQSYPDPSSRELCKKIAMREGLDPEDILCGNGADDLIYRLCLSQKPKRTLLIAPTFSEYEKAALLSGSEIKYHRLHEKNDFALTEKITEDIAENIDMVFLCNPNNPTGKMVEPELIERILARCMAVGSILVIDECFLSFTDYGISSKALLNDYKNLVILDAFTKRYAMAGLRLGYIITKNRLLRDQVREFGQCWSVSAVAQEAGIAALNCIDYQERARCLIKKERRYLSESLAGLGFRVFLSSANYILFRCQHPLVEPLLKKRILIRSCANYEGLDESFYRVCVKKHEENEELIKALTEVMHG
ncbi:MAG: threonine-phosphate decarboxylase [Clostridia bacterium]